MKFICGIYDSFSNIHIATAQDLIHNLLMYPQCRIMVLTVYWGSGGIGNIVYGDSSTLQELILLFTKCRSYKETMKDSELQNLLIL